MNPKDVAGIEDLLKAYAAFAKVARPGEILASGTVPSVASGLEGKAAAGMSKEEFRRVVWIADLMAAALPDNDVQPWRPERQDLASRLRKLYFDAHGENAYAAD